MPIFDNDLLGNIGEGLNPYYNPKPELASPKTTDVNTSMYFGHTPDQNVTYKGGFTLDQLSEISSVQNTATFDSPFQMVPKSELLANKRYGMYERDKDLENIYGVNQSWGSQLGNGLLKMGATAVGTFAQGFATLPDTISAIKNGQMKDLSNPDGYESDIDLWLKNIEDTLPNYYTRYEKEHPFLAAIPGFAGSANFWGDKVIKNIGFTVGAIGSAVVQDAAIGVLTEGVGEIPLLGAQLSKAALYINKLFSAETKVGRALGATEKGILTRTLETAYADGITGESLLSTKKLAAVAASTKITDAGRYYLNLYGSARTEAAVEARDGYRQVKEELIRQYKQDNFGDEPSTTDIEEIDKYATDAMNTRFGINMALLTVSNAIQFDSILKPFSTASTKGLSGSLVQNLENVGKVGLKEGSLDVFEKQIPKTFKGKVWESVKPKLPTILSEGVYEEGGQFAAERGTYDYYTRKYKNPNKGENRNTWNWVDETINSTTKGLKDQFGSDEGIENMLIGGLSAIITGGLMSKVDSIKGQSKDKRLQTSINILNKYGLTGMLQDSYSTTVGSVGIAKDMKAAAESGNIFQYKNFQHKAFFNFVNARIPAGLHETTIMQLEMLKDLDKDQFEKMFGIDFNTSNKSTVSEYVDALVDKANKVKSTVDALDATFKNPYKQIIDPKTDEEHIENYKFNTFNMWKTDLAFDSSISVDSNNRLSSIEKNSMNINSSLNNDLLAKLTQKESLSELSKSYEEDANTLQSTITDLTSAEDRKAIKQQIKTLRTFSERINLALKGNEPDLKLFNDLLNFNLNNRDSSKDPVVGFEHVNELFSNGIDINNINNEKKRAAANFEYLASEKGFDKYFEQQKQIAKDHAETIDIDHEVVPDAPMFVNKDKEQEQVELNREYEIKSTKRATVRKLAEDRFQVTQPDGSKTFHTTRELANEAAKETTDENTNLSKVKIIAINSDGTLKVEDKNGDILNIDPSRLKGYKRILTEQEKLQKDKEQIKKQQTALGKKSGQVPTPDTSTLVMEEPSLKDVTKLFNSTTTESESWENSDKSKPHVSKSRRFLNKVKKLGIKSGKIKAILVTAKIEKALGLEGLTALSYGTNDMTDVDNPQTGFLAAVFVVQDKTGTYFVDEDGNKLSKMGDQVDLEKVIFQTMPTTSLTNSKGFPKYRSNQKAEAEAYAKGWSGYREKIFALTGNKMPKPMSFTVSRGLAKVNPGVQERNQVGGVLIEESKIATQQGLIVIPTAGTVAHNNEAINFPNGVPVLQYADVLEFLNNRKFTDTEAKTIFEVLKALAQEVVDQSNNNQAIEFNPLYTTFLQNVLYWKLGATESDNQIRINEQTLSLELGKKSYSFADIANSEKDIVDQLSNAFISVNNKTLTDSFSDEFTEYSLDKSGKLITKEWTNYQSYLLASVNPDGSPRSAENTPLVTKIAKPSTSVPYTHIAKYATLEGVEFPVEEVKTLPKQQPTPPPAQKASGKFELDGVTPNKQDIAGFGEVTFTAKPGEEPQFDETSQEFIDVRNKIIAASNAARTKAGQPTATDAELIPQVNTYIIAAIKKAIDAQTAPAPTTYSFDGSTPNTYDIPNFGTVTFTVVKGQDPLFEENAEFKKVQQKFIDAVNKAKPGTAKAEALAIANGAIVAAVNKEIGNTVAAPPAAKPSPGSSIKPSDDFRLVGVEDSQDKMTEEELQLFKEWHAEKVPFIPYEILENIIRVNGDKNAWGVFEKGVAKFVRGGLRGTEYHEIMEGIWKTLSPEEQQAILDDEKTREGTFIDRETKQEYNYADAPDQILKERIMDDFSDFRLGKLPARSLSERVLRFFRAILDFFRSFGNNPSLKDELFEAIESGKFKERTLPESVKNDLAEYRAAEGLTEQQTNNFVQDMTARAAGILYSQGRLDLLYSPQRITSQEMFDQIESKYAQEGQLSLITDNAWKELKEKTKLRLRTLGIGFDTNDKVSINDEEANKNDYAPEPFSVDWKKNSTGPIKFTLATLLETAANNQEDNLVLEFPKVALSESIINGVKVRGYKLLNFSRTFATVLDKLSNTTSVSKAIDKLIGLAEYDSNYVRLLSRITKQTDTKKGVSRTVPFGEFDHNDWRFFIEFTQTFTKQKPDALIQYVSAEGVHTGPANLYTAIKEIQSNWIENIKTLAATPGNLITRSGSVYQIRSFKGMVDQNQSGTWRSITPYGDIVLHKSEQEAIEAAKDSDIKIRNTKEQIKFLSEIGVEFPMDVFTRLKDFQKSIFVNQVSNIYAYFGENNDLMSISGKTLKINGPLSKLAELLIKVTNPNQDSTYFGVDGQRIGAFTENNAPSVFENTFNEVDTLEELLELRPELNDIYSQGSQVLKKGGLFFDKEGNRIKSMKVSYIQGTKLTDENQGTATASLTLGDRFTQEINQNLDGNYYILIPADGSTEWMMNLGNTIDFKLVQTGKASSKVHSIFKGYLIDDVALALDYKNREKLNNTKDNAKQLRFFKEILFDKQLNKINEMIDEGQPQEEIEKYIASESKDINKAVDQYINNTVEITKEILLENNEILEFTSKDVIYYRYDNLDINSLNKTLGKNILNNKKLSEKNINDILTYVNINYIINNIEYHKVLFGDPFQFTIKKDGSLDQIKRIKSFLSPRRTTFDTPEFNTFLNDNENVVNGIQLKPGDPGYHNYKSYTNTLTVKDITIAGSLSNLVGAYAKTNEADAMSWLMDNTYKEIKLKNRQWSNEAEAFHQWQMAYTRQNLPGYKYSSTELEKLDKALVAKPSPKYTLEVLKPIVSGNKYNKTNFDLVLDKFSQMPIYYSMVKGTSLEKLYIQMMNQGMGYAIVESGRKVGAEEIHSLYNGDGSFNEEAFNNKVQIPWKSYGIQVETATEGEKTQTRGSQLTKMASMDLFDNGVASSVAAQQEFERNTNLLDLMHTNAYTELLNTLGIVDDGYEFSMPDGKSVSEVLMHEMTRRELSDNAIDTIQLDKETNQFLIPFEASPSYIQIRSIIYSMIAKSLTSPSVSGGAHVQVPVTGFEKASEGRSLMMKNEKGVWEKISKNKYNSLSEEDKSKVLLGDDTLKFYVDEDGQRYCEIMLPHWFKNKFGNMSDTDILNYLKTPEGEKILTGIGFRIPTQSLSSVEVFRVKGFLPQYMGATVVVPSEITTKAGSDFDIDKLNMYLKSIYVDANGNVRLVDYKGSEEATKAFYAQVFEDTVQKDIDRVTQYDQFRETLFKIFDSLESLDIILSEEEQNFYNAHNSLINSIIEQADEADMLPSEYMLDQIRRVAGKEAVLNAKLLSETLKSKFVKEMYKKSLENEYYDSLEKLLTLPENFSRLIAPVEDAGLKDLAKRLDELQGYNESSIKNRTLDRNFMTNQRHAFVVAKRWVGVAAVNITNLSLKQKSQTYIDPQRFDSVSEEDRKFLGDGKIILEHNTVNIDGVDYISLSGTKVANSEELISSRYSGYATAFVDVAKDPFIMKIIKSNLVIGTFMFLENIGVGEQSAYFLNQPIIQEYLKMLDAKSAKWLFTGKNISEILGKFSTTDELINSVGIDQTNFEKNISDYYNSTKEFSEARNAEQHLIFKEFLKYAKMAENNFKFTQATNYDTTRFGSGDEFTKKQMRTAQALSTNIISSVEKVMNTTFIGRQEYLLNQSMRAMGAIFKLEEDQFRAITNQVLESFGSNTYLSADAFNKIALQIKTAFLDYIIQTKLGLNSQIESLLVDESTSVASRLEQAKKDYPNLEIIRDLQVVSSDRVGGAKSIKLNVNTKAAYDENLYTGMMREMRDYNEELKSLYNDIVLLSMLQGTYQSAISIKNIIPIEDYSKIVEPIITPLVADGDLDAFTQGMFQRNNFRNKDVFPSFQPRFYVTDNAPIYDEYYNETLTYRSPSFMKIESLNVEPNHRKIMLLDVEQDSYSIKNDYLSVPRVIRSIWNGNIDFVTGKTVLPADFAIRKAKGDMTLNDVFGYQKVKLGTGEPLVYYKKQVKDGVVTYKPHHVYKLINLYGEGQLANEHYTDFRKSVLNNGTRSIDNEIPDADIINYFGGDNPEVKDVFTEEQPPLGPTEQKPSIFDLRNVALDYTPGQRIALNDVANMIDLNKQNYYLLAGYAGTGKTTLAENIAKYAQASGRTVSILAPTNKAAKVLNDKLKSTGVNANAQTIHKAIYGEPNEFGEWTPTVPLKNSVIIVDESSMIEKGVMNDLLGNTRGNNIIIFMGDGFQLEQIGQDSKLFSALGNKSTFENEYGIKLYGATQLTEVKRQSLDSDILKLATLQRTDDKAYIPTQTVGDVKVVKSREEFLEDYRDSIRNDENSVMVVATNEERMAMNRVARGVKYGANREVLEEGEVLIAIANSTDYSNSEIFKASVVRDDPTKHTLTFTSPQGKTETYDMYFAYVVGEDGIERKVFHFPNVARPSIYHSQILTAIKNSDKALYDELNNDQDIIFSKKGVAKLSPAIVISTYGYAITGHKSQGSQWDKVFVNQNYVSPNWNGSRWFYTAITRAAQQVILMPTANNTRISPEEINKRIDAIATGTTTSVSEAPIATAYEKSERIITRAEVKSNPKTLYLFGDNDERKGLGGQAKEMRGEPNTVGVSTKKYPSNNESSFKTDDELENNKKIITSDINKVITEWNTGKYNKVSVPQIGVGLAALPMRAPQTYAFLQQELNRLEQTVSQPKAVSNDPKGVKVKDGIYVNQAALTKEEQLELFDYLKPFLEEQGAKTNKSPGASKMIGLGLRWDYKSNNPGKQAMNIPDAISEANKTKYGYYDSSINNQPLAPITPRFRELMQKATGIDMTHYDGAIINLYDATSFISSHNDVDESRSALGYPVIGVNLGGTGNFSIESKEDPKQLDLKAGSAYVFGVDGKNRAIYHRTFNKPQDSFLPELTTKIDGKTYPAGSYRVTVTMRRVMPLEPGMPTKPAIGNQTQASEKTPTTQDRQIKVDQYTFTVKPDGSMFYQDGKELTDQTIKNKVNVRKELQDGTLRTSVYNKANYFVLLDGRIVGSGKTNLGKESITDPKIKEAILAKAVTYKKQC